MTFTVMMYKENERHSFEVSGVECAYNAFSSCVQFAELLDGMYNVDLVDNSTGEVIASTDEYANEVANGYTRIYDEDDGVIFEIHNDAGFDAVMDYFFK